MHLRTWLTKDVATAHSVTITLVLIVSAIAGRQFFMDGASSVVQSFLDPLWYPQDQETPRRFFAIVWTTAPVRLIGLLFPSQIQMATFAYGVVTYCQIALPVIITINSRLNAATKSLLVTLFISATVFLSNFAATELLFALGLTTVFVVYSLDAERDPRASRRLFIGFLLLASYEIVALSNILLAIGIYTGRRSKKVSFNKELALFAVLVLALPFQIICHFGEPTRPGHDAFHWFVFEISGIFIAALLVGAIYFKLVGENVVLRTAAPFVAFAVPLCILIIPELIGLRTREFQYAYPSRIYSAGIVALIASLPIILNRDLVEWPSRFFDWFGERPLRDLATTLLAGFYGVSIAASLDAFRYQLRLDKELSQYSGLVSVESCSFCVEPTKFGLPNLSHTPVWPAYGMAHTLMHPELPPVVTFGQGGMGDVSRELVETFMARQLALRNIGSDAAPLTGGFSDTDLSAAQKAGNRERRPDDLKTRPRSDLHVSSQLRSEFSRPE
jgi:hypothetical protein